MSDEHLPETSVLWGEGLIQLHDRLRADLTALRAEVAAYADGASATPSLALQLRANCLAFCTAVHDHHTEEDTGGFPYLREHAPHLAPTLDRLSREHVHVARILDDIRSRLAGLHEVPPPVLRADIDRLATDLEAHLKYEEDQLAETLNTLTPKPENLPGPEAVPAEDLRSQG